VRHEVGWESEPTPTDVGRRLKLQHLHVAMAVAQQRSMGKAAKQLAVSQPVVSKAIADLEHLLGVRLFDRSPQGVEPTLYCRALLKRSLAIFDDVRTSIEEIRFLADPIAGELRIGSTEPLLAGLVIATMERLWLRYPRIALRALQADSATLINRDLFERRIELAVVPVITLPLRADLDATLLYRDSWNVVVGTGSPWARRKKIDLAELTGEFWCAPPLETSIGSLLTDAFRAKGLEPPRLTVSSVMSPPIIARLLENERFVAVMTDSLLNFFYANRLSIKRLPVELQSPSFGIAIVSLQGRTVSPVARLFIEQAQRIGEQLGKLRKGERRQMLAQQNQPQVPVAKPSKTGRS
jgi:DNA-binding transcriptional LysR family regulator